MSPINSNTYTATPGIMVTTPMQQTATTGTATAAAVVQGPLVDSSVYDAAKAARQRQILVVCGVAVAAWLFLKK